MASSAALQGEAAAPTIKRSSSPSKRSSMLGERAAPPAPPTTVPTSTISKQPPPLTRQGSSIARQSSIYSLTLNEIQSALGEPGKDFGSMNMDEFLKNIWTAEESQAMADAFDTGSEETPAHSWPAGIQRQGSISLPQTLSRKTVEDVWKDIAGENTGMDLDPVPTTTGGQGQQATLAEMTLEDFLMKAGVVVKENGMGDCQTLQSFGISFDKTSLDNALSSLPGDNIAERLSHSSAFFGYKGMEDEKPNIKSLPTLSLSTRNLKSSQAGLDSVQMDALKHMSPRSQAPDWLANTAYRRGTTQVRTNQLYGNLPQHIIEANTNKGNMGNGALMGSATQGLGMLAESNFVGPDFGAGVGGQAPCMSPLALKTGSPSSPLSDGVGPSYGSMSPLSYGHDGAIGGRKRGFEGGFEKVVERRQRRMIKNRESAARSRARKQAYTVELEAEVMQLKEENLRLCLIQEEMADMRRNQFIDVLNSLGPHVDPKRQKLRRTRSVPW